MSFSQAVTDSIETAVCNYLGAVDNANSFFNELSPVDLPNLAKYWRPKLCNDDPADVPNPPEDVSGGQCPGVSYDVTWDEFTASGNFFDTETALNRVGPIRIVRTNFNPNGTYEIQLTDANGVFAFATPSGANGDRIRNVVAVPSSGGPNDCGSQTAPIPPYPPGGVNIPISVTYQDNSDQSVNLNGDFTLFAPVFAPVGVFAPVVIAPVRVNLPDINFNGFLELAPRFEFNFGTPPSDRSPGDVGEPPPPSDPPGSPSTPEDESDRRLIGIVVRSVQVGNVRETLVVQNQGPDLWVPRLANAYFRVRNDGVTAWLGPLDVKTTNAFIPVPPDIFAIAGRADAEPGWENAVFPVYSDSEQSS